jgi:hypothetical protein
VPVSIGDLLQRTLFRLTNVASYGQLRRWGKLPSSDDNTVVQFVPSLAAVLAAAEQSAGRGLRESEVIDRRDRSNVVLVPRAAAKDVSANRGYTDISPTNCWQEYVRLRNRSMSAAPPSDEEL